MMIPSLEQFRALDMNQKLKIWNDLKGEFDKYKAAEIQFRKEIVEQNFDATEVGTHNVALGGGWILKGVIKESYKLDSDLDRVEDALDKLPDWLQERLVKWSVSISVAEYKKLEPEQKAIVDTILTISQSSPTLSLVPPKV